MMLISFCILKGNAMKKEMSMFYFEEFKTNSSHEFYCFQITFSITIIKDYMINFNFCIYIFYYIINFIKNVNELS